MKKLRITSITAAIFLALPAYAVEDFALYDNFNRARINPAKWFGGEGCCYSTETSRRIRGGKLHMTHRSHGFTGSNEDGLPSRNRLYFVDPETITQMKARLRIVKYTLQDCVANTNFYAGVRARLIGSFFNTELDHPGGDEGDVYAGVELRRYRDTAGNSRTYDVVAFAGRCNNEDCSSFTDLPISGGKNLGQVKKSATLSVIHDPENNKFVMQVNNKDTVEIPYDSQGWDEKSEPNFANKRIEARTEPENCTAKITAASIEMQADNVKVNRSGIR